MSDSTSTLVIRLLSTGDLSALTKGKEQSENLKLSFEGLKRAMEGLGVGLSIAGALRLAEETVQYAASIKGLSEQANISVEAFQRLSFVAADAGVKQDALSASLAVLNKNMAEAATGATKQNHAIADLGLNTGELLAMPVEEQIKAIASAYVNAADKGKAWAAVIALLGKNSASVRQMLADITEGGNNTGVLISQADILAVDHFDRVFDRIRMNMKAVSVQALAHPGDFLKSLALGPGGLGLFEANRAAEIKPEAPQTDEERSRKIAQYQAEIQQLPQMIAMHRALEKAIQDEAKAYELPAEAAARLRKQADSDLLRATQLASQKSDPEAQLESLKLRSDAAKMRTEANAIENKAAQDRAAYNDGELDFYAKLSQMETKSESIQTQLVEAKGREIELVRQLDGLDSKSLTFQQDSKKLWGDILGIKSQITALEERASVKRVDDVLRAQELRSQMRSIELAAIEHDFTKTDTQKWYEKRDAIRAAINEEQANIALLRAQANDPTLTQASRDKAGNEADRKQSGVSSMESDLAGMGPNPNSFVENLSAGLASLSSQWGTLQQQMARGLTGTISTAVNSVTNNITRLVTGFQTVGQTVRNIAVDIGTTLIQAFVDMGVKWVANRIMMATVDKGIAAASAAALIPIAAAQAAIWATPATLATIASFGGAAVAAPAEMAAAVTAGHALSMFEDGGYTGGMEGRAAGIVHGQEFVWSAPAVRAVGAGNLERAHQAALSGGGGVSAGGGASGASGNIIIAMSPEDVARATRQYTDARVMRLTGNTPKARYAL